VFYHFTIFTWWK